MRLQRCAEAVLWPQFRQRQRRAEQFHVRSRHEIFVRVLLIQGLATLGVHDEQSPLTLVRRHCSKQGFRTRSEFCCCFLRSHTLFLCAAARVLRLCLRFCNHPRRAHSQPPPTPPYAPPPIPPHALFLF